MNAYTPGPWAIDWNVSRLDVFSGDAATLVASIRRSAISAGIDETARANARLIAAAPDMLAALQGLLASDSADMYAIVGRDVDGHPLNAAGVARMNARAAIAKAIPA